MWDSPEEGNTSEAIVRAVSEGFGVEFDVRDQNGEAVIAHDPPEQHIDLPRLTTLLAELPASSSDSFLAINIKSNGLAPLIPSITSPHFFFDMPLPDQLAYRKASKPVATRVSEYEPFKDFEQTPGPEFLWIDAFQSDWYLEPEILQSLMQASATKVFVSPELHGRSYENVWKVLCPLFRSRGDLMICTDQPRKFLELV